MKSLVPALALTLVFVSHSALAAITAADLSESSGFVETDGGLPAPETIVLERAWSEGSCRSTVHNAGSVPVSIRRVVVFRLAHALPPETRLYGEGFTMLSQTGGTLGAPQNIGDYTDKDHYKIPQPADATTVYELLMLSPPDAPRLLLGFTSCRRFVGRFHVRPDSIEAELDTEGLTLEPGASWDLEDFLFLQGGERSEQLDTFADAIGRNHPRLAFDPVPTGWCSWYCYGPMVTRNQVMANLGTVKEKALPLRYIQIDDGYQAAMGDWLKTGDAFGGGIQALLKDIRDAGCEPAIWVAPFVAEEGSEVFQQHPDWFIQDDEGNPLRSDRVTFGGWRRGPWYAVDGTHPEAQAHLEAVFRTMREAWGCTYFKLDANFWGAMHGGRFYDPKATRVEAYRRGMEAVLRGAGDAFVLGCNHPLWPSLGVIHGARTSGDVTRSWDNFKHLARETFHRNWQNGRFWWNDPDCVLLSGKLSDNEYQFHASAILASGGMTLSGDNLTVLPDERVAMLQKLLPPTGVAAKFEDEDFRIGSIDRPEGSLWFVFNWEDTPQSKDVRLEIPSHLSDFWTGEDLGEAEGTYTIENMPPHSARVIELAPRDSHP
ncbi:MAG: alpha-galactosidase [Candidatus Hydrogenedens sp.]|nr:alpha-galactosidase [Candidatus Hydrogenedens sp.]